MTDTNDIKVVVEPEAEEEAYRMGYKRFIEMSDEEIDPNWFEHFTESAEWCNSFLPTLRSMSGASDSGGHGTYTDHQDIVVVDYPEDRPMNGEMWTSRFMTSHLVNKFRDGAYDKLHGNEYGESLE